jgi:osmotically-inducible protein OsmY
VSDRLTEDGAIDASNITVIVTDGEVTLEGTVEHRRIKRDVEDLADEVSGVRQVHNRLRVESGQPKSV